MESQQNDLSLQSLPPKVNPSLLSDLVNLDFGALGCTVSTKQEPNTSRTFHFWLSRQATAARAINIGSIVTAYADDERELVFAAVSELRCFSNSESFMDDFVAHDYGRPDTHAEDAASDVTVATCSVVKTLSTQARPVMRSRVYFPTALGIQFAFGMVSQEGESTFNGSAIPIGIYENGDGAITPVCIDEEYLIGPQAAHLNVSGISGLACKTSALQFCLKSLLCHSRKKVGVLIMNVKANSLLYLDRPNPRLQQDDWSRNAYRSLGIPMRAMVGARFFAPSHFRNRNSTQSVRELATEPFRWDLHMIFQDLPSLFHASEWNDNIEGAWYVIKEEIERGKISSYDDMLGWIDKLLSTSGLTEWPRGFTTATWRKLKSDLRRFTQQYRGLIATETAGVDIPWEELRHNEIFVVDIEMLADGGQKLVFGRCIHAVTQLLEERTNGLDAVIVFVDELNKFAPKADKTALKSQLVDITARGRSLGLIMFGAEQFASSVEKEIVENSGTFMFGRTESSELETSNYNGVSDEMKSRLRMLPQGELLVKFPKFPQPIFVRFPHPVSLPGEDFRLGTVEPVQQLANILV